MCKAMNRSLANVILGGYGVSKGPAMAIEGEARETDSATVIDMLTGAKDVIIVPGPPPLLVEKSEPQWSREAASRCRLAATVGLKASDKMFTRAKILGVNIEMLLFFGGGRNTSRKDPRVVSWDRARK